jgi:hypothetical protein
MGLNSSAAAGLSQLTSPNPSATDENDQLKKLKEANPQMATRMKKGGSASARADGCCVKGKTKGRMV